MKYMTAQEVADYYGIHRTTVYRWEAAGKIPKRAKTPHGGPRWLESEIKREPARRSA
ncbi:MAG: helix-turn-helix transcriptional regulator [Phycisphaerales bacterium JB063]